MCKQICNLKAKRPFDYNVGSIKETSYGLAVGDIELRALKG